MRIGVALAVVALLGSAPAAAQTPPATFSTRADLVVVHATVLDRKGGFVAGLDRDAFTVYEDGTPQTITVFRNEDSPVTVGIVIDNSGSMEANREAVITGGLAFARASHPDDEMFTVNFNEKISTGLPPDRPFTNDLAVLRRALSGISARGRTALHDALAYAIRHLATGTSQKKVLIAVSDGGDNASSTRLDQVVALARQTDVVIYAIGLVDQYQRRDAKPGVLKQLAKETGGETYFPDRIEQTASILERIAHEIRSGYTIGYAPTNVALDGSYRRIQVTVRAPLDAARGRPDNTRLKVRARAGYLAPSGKHRSVG